MGCDNLRRPQFRPFQIGRRRLAVAVQAQGNIYRKTMVELPMVTAP